MFAIERTTDRSKANLFLLYAEMLLCSSLALPIGKKQKITLESSFLPDVPLLTNPENIFTKTRLVALDDMPLRNSMLKEEEAKAGKVRRNAAFAAKQASKETAAAAKRNAR